MADIKRRTVLGLLGATGGLLAAGGSAIPNARASAEALDPGDRRQLLNAFRKLAYSLDDSVTWWWMRGTRYGLVDSVTTPFWDMYIGTWFTTRDLDDGEYEVNMVSANFYTPPNSTELLRTFNNPYTGKEVPVVYAPPRARQVRMTAEKSSPFGELDLPEMKTTQESAIGPGWIEGEDFVIRGDLVLRAEPLDPDSDRGVFHVEDWSTYIGKVSDVTEPSVKNAPCRQYFNDFLTWPAWLQMGDQPGSYVSRCYGTKVFAYQQMPQTWRNLFAQAHPGAASDPVSILTT